MALRNDEVRAYWEGGACGTEGVIVGDAEPLSRAWFARIEAHRYAAEPMIHAVAQFTRHHGARLLEIGVGAGTDHVQWARAGAECHGVDLTEEAITTTRAHLALHGFHSDLRRIDAEVLPFADASFEVVYSWGVIHHSARPEAIVAEIHRVLEPGGVFIGMLYHRRSLAAFRVWVRRALLAGRPWRSLAEVIWHHVESVGTKAYTVAEVEALFRAFATVEVRPVLTPYDTLYWPRRLARFFPDEAGWFLTLRARR